MAKQWSPRDHQPSDGRRRIAVVVEHADRLGRSDGVAVKVSEHLLTPIKPGVNEHDDGNRFIAESRVLLQRLLDGGPAVLSIVDDELRRHWDRERTYPRTRSCAGVGGVEA